MGEHECGLKDGFTWYDKLSMRLGLAALVAIGAVAVFIRDPWLALAYIVLVATAGTGVIYDFFCVYCPYPFRHSDCLFFPYKFLSSVTTLRTTPIPWPRKLLSGLAFAGIVLFPQYWLCGQWGLFAVFWALVVAGSIVIPLRFCRYCRHRRCPMNLTSLRVENDQSSAESIP